MLQRTMAHVFPSKVSNVKDRPTCILIDTGLMEICFASLQSCVIENYLNGVVHILLLTKRERQRRR